MKLIDAEALDKKFDDECATECAICIYSKDGYPCKLIDNAPTIETDISEYSDKLWQKAYERGKAEARPQGEWILISERLPDYMDDILITFQKPNREPVVYRAVFIGSKFALDNGDVWNWNDPEIKAWTPLPEAYKEAENEDSN